MNRTAEKFPWYFIAGVLITLLAASFIARGISIYVDLVRQTGQLLHAPSLMDTLILVCTPCAGIFFLLAAVRPSWKPCLRAIVALFVTVVLALSLAIGIVSAVLWEYADPLRIFMFAFSLLLSIPHAIVSWRARASSG